jgi:hypothetical protein
MRVRMKGLRSLTAGLLAILLMAVGLAGCVSRGPVSSDSSCALLEVTNVNTRGTLQGVIYTVANRTNEQRQFAIYRAGVESTLFTIEAGETKEFGVAAGIAMRAIGGVWSSIHGQRGAAALVNCTPPSQAALAAEGRAAQGSGNEEPVATDAGGATARATAAVNMRAGPGARHAVLGTLRPGDEVTVLSVQGAWCECMAGGRRVFISCKYLSPPAGVWASFTRSSAGQLAIAATNTDEIRLTNIEDKFSGSACRLAMTKAAAFPSSSALVGGQDYLEDAYHLGINGREHLLYGEKGFFDLSLMSADRRVSLRMKPIRRVSFSESEEHPGSVYRVSVAVTMEGKTRTFDAYQLCGDGHDPRGLEDL